MLIDDIKKSFIGAGFREGDRMPSVRKTAQQFGVSVTTIHKAYRELADEGFVKRVQGKGCFWGSVPALTVKPFEDGYSAMDRLFARDLDSGYLNAFNPIPSAGELSSRYGFSSYIIKKFLLRKVDQGILRKTGRRYFFNAERTVRASHYILFVHRCEDNGKLKIESERESAVFRMICQIAVEQKIAVHFVGYHEPSDRLVVSSGKPYEVRNDSDCLGVFLSTWLVNDAQRLFAHFAQMESPISVWWEYAPEAVPLSVRDRKKWAFYNVAFGKEAGKIVGEFLKKRSVDKVHYVSPYHASYWSRARLQGLEESGVKVLPLLSDRFASPFDVRGVAESEGVDIQGYMEKVVGALIAGASLDYFVCANDWVAAAVLDLYRKAGRKAPYVIGFDDTTASYRYVFDSCAFNVETMVREALYHIVAPTIYAEQRHQMQAPLGHVVEKKLPAGA